MGSHTKDSDDGGRLFTMVVENDRLVRSSASNDLSASHVLSLSYVGFDCALSVCD